MIVVISSSSLLLNILAEPPPHFLWKNLCVNIKFSIKFTLILKSIYSIFFPSNHPKFSSLFLFIFKYHSSLQWSLVSPTLRCQMCTDAGWYCNKHISKCRPLLLFRFKSLQPGIWWLNLQKCSYTNILHLCSSFSRCVYLPSFKLSTENSV